MSGLFDSWFSDWVFFAYFRESIYLSAEEGTIWQSRHKNPEAAMCRPETCARRRRHHRRHQNPLLREDLRNSAGPEVQSAALLFLPSNSSARGFLEEMHDRHSIEVEHLGTGELSITELFAESFVVTLFDRAENTEHQLAIGSRAPDSRPVLISRQLVRQPAAGHRKLCAALR